MKYKQQNAYPYDDIINLPHHVSSTHPQMPLYDRAAQFSPFAALTGYDAVIKETERHTAQRITLNEDAIAELDMKLRMIADWADSPPEVAVTYFLPDVRKQGGAYVTATGTVRKVDESEQVIYMADGTKIPLNDLIGIDSQIFNTIF